MTQQINLYVAKVRERKGPALVSLALDGVVAVLLIAYWTYLRGETNKLQARIVQANAQLNTEKAALKSMKDALATRTDPAKLAAELNALRARATEAEEIMAQLKRGDLGTMDGFSGQLVELARAGEPGVWVTNFRITNAGKGVEIQGRSLDSQSVLRYAGEVNQRFAGYGAKLSALEMTPVETTNQAAAQAVQFKLF
jgi:Tfp pilus assembly protein PilN